MSKRLRDVQAATTVEGSTQMLVATATPVRVTDRRLRLVPALPVAFLVLVVAAAVFAPALTAFDPNTHDLTNTMQPPSWLADGDSQNLLGTDRYGRDTFTRLLYGARTSMAVVVISLFIAVVLGGGLGILAGYAGGWIDAVISRSIDVMLALPSILVAIAVAVALGPSFRNVVLILGFLSWPNIARLVRGEALALRQQEFVRYSMTIGVPRSLLLLRHVLPNVLPTLMVTATLEVANIIMAEASLSFLGAGVPPPQASWGSMIDEGRALIATGWWLALFPGLAIAGTVLSFNTFGDWLRDYLDPTTRQVAR